MDASLNNGRACSLLKPQLSTVHHGAKDSQASWTNILTAVLNTCNKEERERERERERGGEEWEWECVWVYVCVCMCMCVCHCMCVLDKASMPSCIIDSQLAWNEVWQELEDGSFVDHTTRYSLSYFDLILCTEVSLLASCLLHGTQRTHTSISL